MSNSNIQRYFAKRILLSSGWAEDVGFTVSHGLLTDITLGVTKKDQDIVLNGPVIPTLANVHSHAFQRVMAGAAEICFNPSDSFWSWRDLMYKVVQKLTPDDIKVISTQLYIDMLKAGYSQVGEFHYLHHNVGGGAYRQPAEMALKLYEAADKTGIGVTMLPVLYSYSGFGGEIPSYNQMRFINTTDSYLEIHNTCDTFSAHHDLHRTGICFHSLRAVSKEQIETILAAINKPIPIHIHISEQLKEVKDCLQWSGQRPVEWLHNEIGLDKRWCLVHATHLDSRELESISANQAVVGLCPTTEANLGDGIFPAVDYEKLTGRWGIGSDSNVSLSVAEELRLLEYSQRLRDQKRNRLYGAKQCHIGDHLFQQALIGGNQACDVSLGLSVGNRADFMVLDNRNAFINASENSDLLNRWIFACNENVIKDVFVSGRQVICDFHHEHEESSQKAFSEVIKKVMYN